MGPTNVALVKLFRAEQALREAQGRLDAASRHVRLQERRVAELSERLRTTQASHRSQQSQAAQLDLDLRGRDAHIEKLRSQQQSAKNNKEYQAFLVEISTAKVDRNKIEDEAMKVLEQVEKLGAEVSSLQTLLTSEQQKLEQLRAESGQTVARLSDEVEKLRPQREQAAQAIPAKARDVFERLSDRYEGEAMAPLAKPNRRSEEYLCTSCNMSLVADVYNKLHSRDELVFCPSCGRMLYIPEDLPPEAAINPSRSSPTTKRKSSEPRAKGKWGELLSAAQGESVKAAVDAGNEPVPLQVMLNGELAGHYKGKSRENFERVLALRMQEAGLTATVEVLEHVEQHVTEQTQG